MAKPKKTPAGTHIEYSPSAKKRIARAMNGQERRWAAKSGPVSVRNIFVDELVVQIAAHRVANDDRQVTLRDLVDEIAHDRLGYDHEVVTGVIESRLLGGDAAPFTRISPDLYRIREAARSSASTMFATEGES